MSTPRTKRPFAGAASDPAQRQITSFFHATGTGSTNPPSSSETTLPSRPVLPADTQSNLLNVGMRVRKSVPEGYKTGTYCALNLFNDLENKKPNSAGAAAAPARALPSSYAAGQRELLPFCGINKIGGLSSQPTFCFSAPPSSTTSQALGGQDSLPGIDDVPPLSSSQDSVASTTGALSVNTNLTPNANRKRVYEEAGESDTPSVSDCLQVPSGDWMDGQVSPRSLVPAGWENTRVMAVPRKVRRTLKAGQAPAMTITGVDEKALDQLGQENMVVDDDFPEADFLDYRVLAGEPMDI